jgi:hypothetical protein
VSKKPHKVEEAATPYAAKMPAKAALTSAAKTESTGVSYMGNAAFKKASAKVFKVHRELFRKSAQ